MMAAWTKQLKTLARHLPPVAAAQPMRRLAASTLKQAEKGTCTT